MDFLVERVLFPALVVLIVLAVFIGLPMMLYAEWQQSKSPTFTLHKNEWACTQMQRVPITTYVTSGKVMVPITTYSDECHQWSKQP